MSNYGSIPLETLREIACNKIVQLRTEEARVFSNKPIPHWLTLGALTLQHCLPTHSWDERAKNVLL